MENAQHFPPTRRQSGLIPVDHGSHLIAQEKQVRFLVVAMKRHLWQRHQPLMHPCGQMPCVLQPVIPPRELRQSCLISLRTNRLRVNSLHDDWDGRQCRGDVDIQVLNSHALGRELLESGMNARKARACRSGLLGVQRSTPDLLPGCEWKQGEELIILLQKEVAARKWDRTTYGKTGVCSPIDTRVLPLYTLLPAFGDSEHKPATLRIHDDCPVDRSRLRNAGRYHIADIPGCQDLMILSRKRAISHSDNRHLSHPLFGIKIRLPLLRNCAGGMPVAWRNTLMKLV